MTSPAPQALSMEHTTDVPGEVLQKVNEGFRVLADLHSAISTGPGESTAALEHVTAATRELAAIQRLFDRRIDR